nr:hypothetical protein Iba_chr10eCG7300 [Ipomoea batatas]
MCYSGGVFRETGPDAGLHVISVLFNLSWLAIRFHYKDPGPFLHPQQELKMLHCMLNQEMTSHANCNEGYVSDRPDIRVDCLAVSSFELSEPPSNGDTSGKKSIPARCWAHFFSRNSQSSLCFCFYSIFLKQYGTVCLAESNKVEKDLSSELSELGFLLAFLLQRWCQVQGCESSSGEYEAAMDVGSFFEIEAPPVVNIELAFSSLGTIKSNNLQAAPISPSITYLHLNSNNKKSRAQDCKGHQSETAANIAEF